MSGNIYDKTSPKTQFDFVQMMLIGFVKQGSRVHIHD